MQGWFFGLMAVSNQTADQIDQEIDWATAQHLGVWAGVAGVLDLRNVFEWVDNRFDNRPFTEEKFVGQRHQAVFHVGGLGENSNGETRMTNQIGMAE